MSYDKFVERERYDAKARLVANQISDNTNSRHGAENVIISLRTPYLEYEKILRTFVTSDMSVLELGAGTGLFTGVLLYSGARVFATDISPKSLEVLESRYHKAANLNIQLADMESLPFLSESFDMVTSAGSLSYGDNELVMNEILRVLKPGGSFICVDSLNHNIVYRFNRWLHFLRGNRTMSTLKRMPTISLINKYSFRFGRSDVQFFGAATWAVPIISRFLGEILAARICDHIDRYIGVRKSAFKFVMIATKIPYENN